MWTYYKSREGFRKYLKQALIKFNTIFSAGEQQSRYRIGALPHLLFLYSDHFDGAFHQAAIQEMLRVAAEIRVFPLLTLSGEYSPYVEPVIQTLRADGLTVSIQKVAYELQRGGNEMLWARHP